MNDPSFRWHWGNGVGGTTFNAHSYPEHRYSYDIVIWDTSNQTFADPAKMDQNDNFYAWGQDVLAISDGDVIFANASFEDNFGTTANANSTGANLVVIHNTKRGFYHFYAHFQQNKVFVSAGDTVAAGMKLGLLGNSGGSSEPHLHLGISRRDARGLPALAADDVLEDQERARLSRDGSPGGRRVLQLEAVRRATAR